MLMTTLSLLVLTCAGPQDWVEPQDACEAASTVLKDMRYVEGQYAEPGDFSHPKIKARIDSCVGVATLAAPHGRDVVFTSIAIAIAYNETNFRKGVAGAAGEQGRMQVMPKHHCRKYADRNDGKGGCTNPDRAGVRAIRILLKRHRLTKALRLYNGGRDYAEKVTKFVRAVERAVARRLAKG